VSLFADNEYTPTDSEGLSKLEQISDYTEQNSVIVTIHNQKTGAQKLLVTCGK
jgi:hypothetical protein